MAVAYLLKRNWTTAILSLLLFQATFRTILLYQFTVTNDVPLNIQDQDLFANIVNPNNDPTIIHSPPFVPPPNKEQCSLYLATSTIPNAGWGVFTTMDIPSNTRIDSLSDIGIPLYDVHTHHHSKSFWWMIQSYHWNGDRLLPKGQGRDSKEQTMLGQFISSINGHPGLHNVHLTRTQYDVSRYHNRTQDPGTGAISPYSNLHTETTSNVQAGQELFFSYGDKWFQQRENVLGEVPLSKDYKSADKTIHHFMQQHNLTAGLFPTQNKEETQSISTWTKLQSHWNDIRKQVSTSSKVKQLLPSNLEDMLQIHSMGGTIQHLIPTTTRSNLDIQSTGYCIDNIYIQPSTISQAGRGAFASRYLSKGSIVAPVPLMHTNRHAMTMKPHNVDLNSSITSGSGKGGASHQLLLNYCFGHESSSLILCPYGSLAHMMNHDGAKPNVKLQWADINNDSSFPHVHPSWLTQPVENIMKHTHAGLMMQVIALRNIEPGEEIVLDYGSTWEHAWEQHVQQWTPPPTTSSSAASSSFVSAFLLNQYNPKDPRNSLLRTMKEQILYPYPSNVQIMCEYHFSSKQQQSNIDEEQPKLTIRKTFPDAHIEEETEIASSSTSFNSNMHIQTEYLRPCNILSRKPLPTHPDTHYRYSAQILHHSPHDNVENNDQTRIPLYENHIIEDMPRSKIIFQDMPYHTDPQLPNVFRKEIGLPEDMIPDVWKDLT